MSEQRSFLVLLLAAALVSRCSSSGYIEEADSKDASDRQLTEQPVTTKAAVMYLRVAPKGAPSWPSWLPLLERSAAANSRLVTFYFIGQPRIGSLCANCVDVFLDEQGLAARIEKYLGVTPLWSGALAGRLLKGKVTDLKPMWPALFPELTSQHEWIGVVDADIIFGDLAAEIESLSARDDLLVPSQWHPAPLANGNLMLYRTTETMIRAYKRSAAWVQAATRANHRAFDEWHGREPEALFMNTLLEMTLNDEIHAKPTTRLLVMDIVGLTGHPADVFRVGVGRIEWRWGKLRVDYSGPCLCPIDIVPQFSIAQCAQCVKNPGVILTDVHVNRSLEVLGLHFMSMKHHVKGPIDGCANKAGFALIPKGFGFTVSCLD